MKDKSISERHSKTQNCTYVVAVLAYTATIVNTQVPFVNDYYGRLWSSNLIYSL